MSRCHRGSPGPTRPWSPEEFEPYFSAEGWALLQRLDGAVSVSAFVEEASMTLFFGRVDGRWRLVGMDIYGDACG